MFLDSGLSVTDILNPLLDSASSFSFPSFLKINYLLEKQNTKPGAMGHGACYFKAWEAMGKRLLWPKKHWSFEQTRIFLVGGPSPATSLSLPRGLMAIIGGKRQSEAGSLWVP